MADIYQIRVELRRTKPPVWRRLAVPGDITLGDLHQVIQIAMGWMNCHLHQFVLQGPKPTREERAKAWGGTFEEPLERLQLMEKVMSRGRRVFEAHVGHGACPMGEAEGEDEDKFTLAEVCPKAKSKIDYEYDFGDGWDHRITVQKIFPSKEGVVYPYCQAGKLACPPEDCGGLCGYYNLLDALENGPESDWQEELVEWIGEEFDPMSFDCAAVNKRLKGLSR